MYRNWPFVPKCKEAPDASLYYSLQITSMKNLVSLGLLASVVMATGCQEKVASAHETIFFDRTAMDSTVSPTEDFFYYANGAWVKTAKIPDDYPSWGSFTTLYDDNLKKLKTLLEKVSSEQHDKGSLEQKAGDFYASGMDTAAIEKRSYEPLKPALQKIDAAKNYKEILDIAAGLYKEGAGDFLGFNVGSDEKNSTKNIAIFYQSGLSFPEKGYYTRQDSASVNLRKKLADYAGTLFQLTGADAATAAKQAESVVQLETKIAASHRTPVELRDPQSNYNKMSVDAAQQLAPNLDWKHLFSVLGITTDSINIGQPAYFKALSSLLASEPLDAWKAKLRYDYISDHAELLSKDFRVANFNFEKELTGQKAMTERWKKVVGWSDEELKDIVGQLYVKEYFPPEAKKRMDTLVNNLQIAFRNRIQKLDWMTDSTRQKALAKLDAILKKIGYPDKWKDYSDVTIDRTNLFANFQNLAQHEYKERIGKINQPVDRTEWGMTPSTVNAYYNPSFNEIVFPAGILQFPFFDMNADDAINYGAIGMVIGHEITHGFDDQGRQYDRDGNMKDWWMKADADQFNKRAGIMVSQYNGFLMFDTLHVNGALTLGENLADLGGLNIAYDAFKLTKQGQGNEKIDGFTPDQRFFLGYAQIWRTVERPEYLKTLLTVDPHSPNHYRVNGPLSNFEPFYAAFSVTPTNKMYRPDSLRVKIW
jgi:putative endopeptidase